MPDSRKEKRLRESQGRYWSVAIGRRQSGPLWLLSVCVALSAVIGAVAGLAIVYGVDIPKVNDLENFRPISNTWLYDDKGRVFGSFALQRRIVAKYEDYPKILYDAVLSIEDKDFEKHSGFQVSRVFGSAYHNLISRGGVQGASTLTMQLARNLYLSSERSYARKIREVLLAIQIERRFTKRQIFTLYANQIYLGHGVYGFAAGAQYYFGKSAKDLTLDEAALLAALPKAPNIYSPIRNPEKALLRRNLVINAMVAAGKISPSEAAEAKSNPLQLHIHDDPNSLAPYFVDDVRQYLERKYGAEQVHESGLRVYTTLNMELQKAANQAVLDGLDAYERRHGWHVRLKSAGDQEKVVGYSEQDWNGSIKPGDHVHAIVGSVRSTAAQLRFGQCTATINNRDVAWTNRSVSHLLSAGDIVYVKILSLDRTCNAHVELEQESGVQGALLAIDNLTGDVKAMVGGRDFSQSQFNRATQALRQVGSSFKPYVYTAAIDRGAEPDDVVVDAPVIFTTASGPYVPHNYDQKFEGAITLRHALAESRNIPALKVAQDVGIRNVISYVRKFGIAERIPPYLPIALGAAELTLKEHTSAFSVFPNDGVRAIPRYITKVTDFDGQVLEQNNSVVDDVISVHTARIMTSMLRDVVLRGTAAAATKLKAPVAGKTGTTNNFTDAWFVGFSPSLTCGVWIGFDDRRSLGNKETGALAALPVWMEFMKSGIPKGDRGRDFAPVEGEEFVWNRGAGETDSRARTTVLGIAKATPKPGRSVLEPASGREGNIR